MLNKLDSDEEIALIAQAQSGDRDAQERLILAHMPFLHMVAGRMHAPGTMHEELMQAGCIGLLMAASRFNLQADTRLLTYALPWILGEMRRAMRSAFCDEALHTLKNILAARQNEGEVDALQIELRLAMEALPQDEYDIIYLRFFCDRTQAEVAKVMGKSQSQISKAEQRILQKLRLLLSGE